MKKTLFSFLLSVSKNYELNVKKITARGSAEGFEEPMKQYVFHIFSDGSEELIDIGGEAPVETSAAPEKTGTPSAMPSTVFTSTAKLYQTLQVLDHIRLHKDEYKKPNGEPDSENALRAGIKYAAEQCGNLPVATVMDKLTRKMGVRIGFWKDLVYTWLKKGDFTPITEFLTSQINNNKNERARENDKAALKAFVDAL